MNFDATLRVGDVLSVVGGIINLFIFVSIYFKMPSAEFFNKLKRRLHLLPNHHANPMLNLDNIYNSRDTNVSEDNV